MIINNRITSETNLQGEVYVDFSYDSGMTESGELITLSGRDAVENSLRLWLYSFFGERIRLPKWGGYITRWIYQPLTIDSAMTIKSAIISGIEDEFRPMLQLSSLEVTPDLESDCWIIEMSVKLISTGEEIHTIENIRRII